MTEHVTRVPRENVVDSAFGRLCLRWASRDRTKNDTDAQKLVPANQSSLKTSQFGAVLVMSILDGVHAARSETAPNPINCKLPKIGQRFSTNRSSGFCEEKEKSGRSRKK